MTIDGADEVDKDFNGIKGGGAALLWEKIVATNSNKIVWIVDESKVVDTIGKFPLPVEVIPFGAGQVIKKFESRGYKPVLRLDAEGQPVRTDENNYVVDLHLERIDHPEDLAEDLITTVGVVEHGLFLHMVDQVIVGDPNGPPEDYLRWWRVLRSSLRCFFLLIRLRRFLMTEPISASVPWSKGKSLQLAQYYTASGTNAHRHTRILESCRNLQRELLIETLHRLLGTRRLEHHGVVLP